MTAPPPLVWSRNVSACPRGLSLARERGEVLCWDGQRTLTLLGRTGERRAHYRAPVDLAAAGLSDDGSACAACGQEGQVWLLTPDLGARWERRVPRRPVALALDSFGQYLAVTDEGGGLHVFDPAGRPLWQVDNPRPLLHLAFVPEKPFLVGSADFGLVACFDMTGRCAWRDGLVAHVGSLAVDGGGDTIALACFGDGLCCYAVDRGRPEHVAQAAPCRLADLSYDGRFVLTAALDRRVSLRRRDGGVLVEFALDSVPSALALGPLAEQAVLALPEGKVVALALAPPAR